MTDDPTTTGPEDSTGRRKLSPLEFAEHLRGLPGGSVTEHSPFEINLSCDLIFTVANNALTISLEMKGGGEPDNKATSHAFPLGIFGGPENLNSFLAELKRNYFRALRPMIVSEAVRYLEDVRAGVAALMELENTPRAAIIKRHTDATAAQLEKELLAPLPERTKSGVWTKIALRHAVMNSALRLYARRVRGRALDLDAINDELRRMHGEMAPQSGEALRKQLADRGLRWRQLKAEVEGYARLHFEAEDSPPENGGKSI